MQRQQRKRLGDILHDAKVISSEQLKKGLDLAKKERLPLGKTLVKLGLITQHDIIVALSQQLGIPYIALNNYQIDQATLPLIPEDLARQNNLLPLFKIGNALTIAMVDPLNVFVIDEISRLTGLEVEPAVCTEEELRQSYEQYYGDTAAKQEMSQIIQDADEGSTISEEIEALEITDSSDSAPVIKLVNLVLSEAIKERVSDIHIEPEEDCLRVRYRTDGILREVFSQPKNLQNPIISRVKIMSELNIAERRIPQDGRVQIKIDGHEVDIRVSTLPTVHGENIVMRILDKTNLIVNLDEIGMTKKLLEQFKIQLARPFGIILVTGPTGSGKTTTLYSALNSLNATNLNIVTVEDPVEYRMKLIRQSQVNPRAGLTFATGLRSILRQDPDIVMVGEIRDSETAGVAVQAALTGHLVLSTLHTNDAPGAINRLIDMGVEPFLVASASSGIVAQRLVRRICEKCKEEYTPPPALLRDLNLSSNGKKITFFRGKGCRFCKKTGYKGRMALFEILIMNDPIKEMVLKKESAAAIKQIAVKTGFKTIRHDGLLKALKGQTSIEEVMRVTTD